MTAQLALREVLRGIVGPAAREHGYKGSGKTWRRTNEFGDCAVVNVSSSTWSSKEMVRCAIDVALVPSPWLDWQEFTSGLRPKAPTENFGLYRQHLYSSEDSVHRGSWWRIDGPAAARAAASDMLDQLAIAGWPILDQLLDREAMLAQVRCGDLGNIKARFGYDFFFARAESVLLTEYGPGPELDAALDRMIELCPPELKVKTDLHVAWLRNRAQSSNLSSATPPPGATS